MFTVNESLGVVERQRLGLQEPDVLATRARWKGTGERLEYSAKETKNLRLRTKIQHQWRRAGAPAPHRSGDRLQAFRDFGRE